MKWNISVEVEEKEILGKLARIDALEYELHKEVLELSKLIKAKEPSAEEISAEDPMED